MGEQVLATSKSNNTEEIKKKISLNNRLINNNDALN